MAEIRYISELMGSETRVTGNCRTRAGIGNLLNRHNVGLFSRLASMLPSNWFFVSQQLYFQVSDSLDYRIIGGRQIIDAAKGRPSHVNQDKVRKYASFRRIESAFEYLLFRHPQHNAW